MNLPGLVTGEPLSGQGVGEALVKFLPCLPHEGPPGMPRAMGRALYPQGFNPFAPFPAAAPAAPPAALIPPAPAAPPVPAPPAVDANGNQIQRRQPVPAPRKRVLERGTFPEWH
ncbi:hypothetical protein ES703_124036 [subsurface metagenome]